LSFLGSKNGGKDTIYSGITNLTGPADLNQNFFPKNGKIFAIMATLFRCGVARHVLAAAHAANHADRRSRLRPVPQHRLHLNHDQPAGPRRDRIRLNEDRERAEAPETGKTKSGSIPNDLDVEDEWN